VKSKQQERQNNSQLPEGWEWKRLGAVLSDIVGGGTPSKSNPKYWSGTIPWLTVKDMRTRQPADSIDHISADAIKKSATNLIPKDTVIIATRVGLGKVIRVPYEATINQDLKALIASADVYKSYLEYWIMSIAQYLESIGSGTTVKGIRLEALREIPFPLAPLDQQKQIASEIEKQFSRLDEAVAALKRIKANLKRYKASVLKAAVEGKLTEEWRKRNPDIESAEKLLKRILAERKKKWEEKNPGKKYKEPVAPDTSNLQELPKGWVWAKLREIKEDIENVNPKMNPDKDFIYLDIASIDNTQQKITTPKRYLGKDAPSRARQLIKTGDILFSTVRTYLKNIAIVYEKYNNQIASTGFCVIRPLNPINKKLFFYYVQTKSFLNSLNQIQRGTSYPAVRDSDVFEQVSPLPPVLEQQKIVEEIESRLSVAEEIEETININLKRAERLRQSILKKAFSGRLISSPQDMERADV